MNLGRVALRDAAVVAGLASLGVLAAGCGGAKAPSVASIATTSTKAGSTGQSNDQATGLEFAQCMRSHGVPSFPDPEDSAYVQIPVSFAKNPSPAFTAAMRACKYLTPTVAPRVVSASQKAAALKLAQCMREHGVPNYPDPTYKAGQVIPPSLVDPAINPASPAFSAASKTCQGS